MDPLLTPPSPPLYAGRVVIASVRPHPIICPLIHPLKHPLTLPPHPPSTPSYAGRVVIASVRPHPIICPLIHPLKHPLTLPPHPPSTPSYAGRVVIAVAAGNHPIICPLIHPLTHPHTPANTSSHPTPPPLLCRPRRYRGRGRNQTRGGTNGAPRRPLGIDKPSSTPSTPFQRPYCCHKHSPQQCRLRGHPKRHSLCRYDDCHRP